MKEYIELVAEGKDLTEEQAKAAMEILLSGEASQAQIGAFLMGLRMKGETLDELTGFAGVLRDKADTISPKVSNYVDLVGTGGDCICRCSSRTPGSKAWQSFHFFKERSRRCIRGTGRKYYGRACKSRSLRGESRNRIYVCTAL